MIDDSWDSETSKTRFLPSSSLNPNECMIKTSINSPLTQEAKLKHSVGRGVEEDHGPKHKGGIVLDRGSAGNRYHTVRSAGAPTLRGGAGSVGERDS